MCEPTELSSISPCLPDKSSVPALSTELSQELNKYTVSPSARVALKLGFLTELLGLDVKSVILGAVTPLSSL